MERLPKEISELAFKIGEFFLQKNKDDRKAASGEIVRLKVRTIEIPQPNTVRITLARPGLLIGPKGATIKALEEYLKMKVLIVEAANVEDEMLVACWDAEDGDLGLI